MILNKRGFVAMGACLGVALFSSTVLAEGGHAHINDLIEKYSAENRSFENEQLGDFYKDQGFRDYLASYPVGPLVGGFSWSPGMGTEFTGPVSGYEQKAPFTDYIPLPDGPVLDEDKTYRIGFAYHGANHPWLVSLADSAVYEANRHPNVEIEVRDAEFDDSRMGRFIDTWIAKQFDAIVIWPAREAPMGPPVNRAIDAGIPVVTVDRRTSSNRVSSEVIGNFYANGLQQGLFLNEATGGEGSMILNRKPLGSTADAMRTGAFLEAIGDENYTIAGSFHTNSLRKEAFNTTLDALQSHDDLDIIFNTGGEEALGALGAAREAGRLRDAKGDKQIVILANDDSKEAVNEVRKGNLDMVAPYTPLLGDIGVRLAIKHIGHQAGLIDAAPPKEVITPNLPMITRKPMTIEGIHTVTPDEWGYAFGPKPRD